MLPSRSLYVVSELATAYAVGNFGPASTFPQVAVCLQFKLAAQSWGECGKDAGTQLESYGRVGHHCMFSKKL